MTRATWDLKVPGESLGAVDNSRHWNFSIWSTNKGVMAILVEGCNSKNEKKHMLLGWTNYDSIFGFLKTFVQFCLCKPKTLTLCLIFILQNIVN